MDAFDGVDVTTGVMNGRNAKYMVTTVAGGGETARPTWPGARHKPDAKSRPSLPTLLKRLSQIVVVAVLSAPFLVGQKQAGRYCTDETMRVGCFFHR